MRRGARCSGTEIDEIAVLAIDVTRLAADLIKYLESLIKPVCADEWIVAPHPFGSGQRRDCTHSLDRPQCRVRIALREMLQRPCGVPSATEFLDHQQCINAVKDVR